VELYFPCCNCDEKLRITSDLAGQKVACGGCGVENEAPLLRLGPGLVLGGFLLERHLGKGAMGDVFLARQLSMDRLVAVKTLPPQMTINEEAVGRFLNEVQMTAQMSHPNIVTAFDAGSDDGTYYLAMAFVDGQDCKKLVEDDGAFAEAQALSVIRDVSKALRYAWEEFKVLHRDVKPENIMIDRHDTVRLMDMGISKSLNQDGGITMDGMVVGTPHYMSPEQAWSEAPIDFRADMYSVGATAYYLLSGRPPYVGTVQSVFQMLAKPEPIAPVAEVAPTISPATAALVDTMLAPDFEDRHENWESFLADLDRVIAGKMPEHRVKKAAPSNSGPLRQGGPGSETKVTPEGATAAFSLKKLGGGDEPPPVAPPEASPEPAPTEDGKSEASALVGETAEKEADQFAETTVAPAPPEAPAPPPPPKAEEKSGLRLAKRESDVPPRAVPPGPDEEDGEEEGAGKGPLMIVAVVAAVVILGIVGIIAMGGKKDPPPASITDPVVTQPSGGDDGGSSVTEPVGEDPVVTTPPAATDPAPQSEPVARWVPIGVDERKALEDRIAGALAKAVAAYQPDKADLARELGLPWPLPTIAGGRQALEEEVEKQVGVIVDQKYPAHSYDKYLAEAMRRHGPYQIGKPITLQLRYGKGTVSGILREVGGRDFKIDTTTYPLHHLETADRDRMSEVKARARAEAQAKSWHTANEGNREALAKQVRGAIADKIYTAAGLIKRDGGWVSAAELLEQAANEKRAAQSDTLRTQIRKKIYTEAGYESRAGIWGRTNR
jgi:serine/threonine-protein kinase